MRKGLAVLPLVLLMLSSCISYTVEMGYSRIELPEQSRAKVETRYRLIDPDSLPVIQNPYPDDLSEISYPYLYEPMTGAEFKDSIITEISIMVVPLGYSTLADEEIETIISALSDIPADFIVLTGSLENQVKGAAEAGMNAVTLKGGTVLFRSEYLGSDGQSASFRIADGKDIEIASASFDSTMPSSPADIVSWTDAMQDSGDADKVKAITDGMDDPESILVLSSSEPSTLDWTMLTLRYRGEKSFPISDQLISEGWTDAYRATHFSPETDVGATRVNGSIYERMDFIYTKGMMPSWAMAFPVKGLTDIYGTSVLLADIIIP